MDKNDPKQLSDHIIPIAEKIMELYWTPLFNYLKNNEKLIKTFPGFILKHEKLIFYFGKTHLAIEYYGPERISELPTSEKCEITFHDYTQCDKNFIEQIIGFEYDSTTDIEFPLAPYFEDLILPTNKGFDKLRELNWNFAAQESMIGFNFGKFYIPKGEFVRMVNSLFFDADDKGLKTRHIKWIDFIPLDYDDSNEITDSIAIKFGVYNEKLVFHDAHYAYPLPDDNDFQYSKLPKINRLIEKIGDKTTTEPQITAFLAEEDNKFILSMAFLALEIYHQLKCEWQSEDRSDIQPDFFVLRANGYADIVEFKLPQLKSKFVTGKENRETFSAEINSYISQTRTYREYFNDPNNRKWFEVKYGFKVTNPRRILVIGRRWDFDTEEWKKIVSDYHDLEIITYDDIIDGITAQFYK